MSIGFVDKPHIDLRKVFLRRMLESISTENLRVAGLGPGLFSLIVIGIFFILLFYFSRYLHDVVLRRAILAFIFTSVLIIVIVFATASYVNDTSQLFSTQLTDNTYIQRVQVLIVLSVWLCFVYISMVGSSSSPLSMHRQGYNIQAHVDAKV